MLGRNDVARNILILGASYGSLLGTKLLMAGHNVTLVCRRKTADLINREGTEVRIKLRDEKEHRAIHSRDLPGKVDAMPPEDVDVSRYDLVGLAMQEPQYNNHTIRVLMIKIAAAKLPCLSIMNMPPLPYLKRIPALAAWSLRPPTPMPAVWDRFEPGAGVALLPDPQAFRPPEEEANVLHVGLPTNFKAATFDDEAHNRLLRELEADIDAVRLDGQDVPVKLKVFDSLFVPLAKWSMLLTGNYRCITRASRNRSTMPSTATWRARGRSTTTSTGSPGSSAPTRPTRCRSRNTPRPPRACSSRPRRRARWRTVRPTSSASTCW